MSRTPTVRNATDAHLRRIGTDLRAFLTAGLNRGDTPETMAQELYRITEIEVHPRTVYRWIEGFGIRVAS